eukprot:7316057-Prymnesium_polylepis.1
MSDSTRLSLEYASSAERDVVRSLTGKSGAADGIDEAEVRATVSATDAGFDTDELSTETQLDSLPPLESVLKFGSENGSVLKGREIMYHFDSGWFRGRLLKPASGKSVKHKKRICNFRVFFDADDELLNLPLYSSNYAKDASSPTDTWMLLSQAFKSLALMPPQP